MKYTKELAIKIREDWDNGLGYKELGKKYNIAPKYIGDFIHNRMFFDENYIFKQHTRSQRGKIRKGQLIRKFTNEEVVKIRELAANGVSQKALKDMFNVGYSTLGRILTGKVYKDAGGPIRIRMVRSKIKYKRVV